MKLSWLGGYENEKKKISKMYTVSDVAIYYWKKKNGNGIITVICLKAARCHFKYRARKVL